jgi:two-component system LytT family response regulator
VTPLRVLVVDDEPLARERLRSLLAAEPEVALVGECHDGQAAIDAIRALAPDLVFLDVQMPEVTGFDVLAALAPQEAPAVVFVTAFDHYALDAFEVHALDYLLKPFDRERFARALDRARAHLVRGDHATEQKLVALLEDVRAARRGVKRLVVRERGRVFFLKVESIDWIEAAGNYARVHVGKDEHLLRETMKTLEARLDPAVFVRIHRSAIVNLERVRELVPSCHGEFVVLLAGGAELTSSRGYGEPLRRLAAARLGSV